MHLYAITDRRSLGDDEPLRQDRLLALCAEWARGGVDTIQIREKDLEPETLVTLARRVVEVVRAESQTTRALLNGGPELALAAGADGVHLPGGRAVGEIAKIRDHWRTAGRSRPPLVSVACHSVAEVERAEAEGADLAVLAPVFGKHLLSGEMLPGIGLDTLTQACKAAGKIPVIALGGVTVENAHAMPRSRLCGGRRHSSFYRRSLANSAIMRSRNTVVSQFEIATGRAC